MISRIFHVQALSALHVGTGQGVGVVDLPIARARATNLPIVAGSALKGVLRDELTGKQDKSDINLLFGPDNASDPSHAGAVAFGDAHLLLLPIRSFAGVLAYATCPFILQQYKRDTGVDLAIPTINDNTARITDGSSLKLGNKIALEDLDINAEHSPVADEWANAIVSALYPDGTPNGEEWRQLVSARFVILPDDVFSFLADTATEIRTRIRIDRTTRTVQDGALWTEENLPAESVLWGVLGVANARKQGENKPAEALAQLLPQGETTLQIGGKHTVGRGVCRLLIAQHNKGA